MSGERFTNARVHEWLTPTLDEATATMHTTRVQLNSAALWWFCHQLEPQERAEILGEYVKVQALGGRGSRSRGSEPANAAAKNSKRPQRRKRG
jgi:hypothetical protein